MFPVRERMVDRELRLTLDLADTPDLKMNVSEAGTDHEYKQNDHKESSINPHENGGEFLREFLEPDVVDLLFDPNNPYPQPTTTSNHPPATQSKRVS